jgi:hypothetical protein
MPRTSKTKTAVTTGPRLVRKTTEGPSILAAPSSQDIASRAYEIFVQEGCQHGNHLDHWLRAERELTEIVTARPAKRVAGTRAQS